MRVRLNIPNNIQGLGAKTYVPLSLRREPFGGQLHASGMSRAAADATRFTATSPHAFAKPTTSRLAAAKAASPRSNGPPPQQKRSIPGSSNKPGGPTETPAQKVARLRAAHAAKRASEISTWDRIVVRGRSVADSAHRITVMGLVILTGSSLALQCFCRSALMLVSSCRRGHYDFLIG